MQTDIHSELHLSMPKRINISKRSLIPLIIWKINEAHRFDRLWQSFFITGKSLVLLWCTVSVIFGDKDIPMFVTLLDPLRFVPINHGSDRNCFALILHLHCNPLNLWTFWKKCFLGSPNHEMLNWLPPEIVGHFRIRIISSAKGSAANMGSHRPLANQVM